MFKMKKTALFLLCSLSFLANLCHFSPLSAVRDSCFGDVTIGADFLYWNPCVSDLHFAVEAKREDVDPGEGPIVIPHTITTKYLCCEWDPGYRLYLEIDNIWGNFNGGVAYTHFNSKSKCHTKEFYDPLVNLSTSLPVAEDFWGHYAEAEWELEYRTVDGYLSLPLNVACGPCLEVKAVSGVKWVKYCQKRKDELFEPLIVRGGHNLSHLVTFHRDLEVSAIGTACGIATNFTLCDCLKAHGLFETSVVVGWSENSDKLESFFFEEGVKCRFKNDDDCICFPGIRFMAGLTYETCLCDMNIAAHIGWEYVQWINAPTFPHYEWGQGGVRSSTSSANLTLQGLYAGVDISF